MRIETIGCDECDTYFLILKRLITVQLNWNDRQTLLRSAHTTAHETKEKVAESEIKAIKTEDGP